MDAHPPQELLELEVDEQAARVGAAAHAHLGDLELGELTHELVDGRVHRTAAGVAQEERLRGAQVVQRRESRSVDSARFGLPARTA